MLPQEQTDFVARPIRGYRSNLIICDDACDLSPEFFREIISAGFGLCSTKNTSTEPSKTDTTKNSNVDVKDGSCSE